MGNNQSQLSSPTQQSSYDDQQQQQQPHSSSNKQNVDDIYNKMGYHVLQVQPNSPACGRLVPFFDFIVAANQVVFDAEDSRFSDIFRNNVGQSVNLIVYNIKSDTTREQVIVPSNTWGGSGLAGISIRFCSWEKTMEAVWHVLDVYLNSPAHEAGFQTKTDYIVGTPDMIFNEQDDFITLINNNMYRPIQLYVYSSLTEQVRLLTITPNKNWGGSGSLGCDIGYGLLHRIPTKQNLTSQFVNNSVTSTPTKQQPETQPLLQQQQQQPSSSSNSIEQTLTVESVSPIKKSISPTTSIENNTHQVSPNNNTNNTNTTTTTTDLGLDSPSPSTNTSFEKQIKPVATSSDQFTQIQF